GMNSFSAKQKESLAYYESRYNCVFQSELILDRPIKLQDHLDPNDRSCRYCSKKNPDVAFSKIAHAIPEFIGNKSILSLNECDTCNEFFANQYEDHLSKWMNPLRSASQMRGKSGIPIYKHPEKTVSIRPGSAGPQITFY